VPRGTLWRTPRPSAPFERPPFAEATWEATGGVLGGGPFRRGYLGTYSGLCRTPLPAPGFAPSPAPGRGRVGGYYALTLGRAFASPGRATLPGPTPGPKISVARLGGWVVKGAPPTAAAAAGGLAPRGGYWGTAVLSRGLLRLLVRGVGRNPPLSVFALGPRRYRAAAPPPRGGGAPLGSLSRHHRALARGGLGGPRQASPTAGHLPFLVPSALPPGEEGPYSRRPGGVGSAGGPGHQRRSRTISNSRGTG